MYGGLCRTIAGGPVPALPARARALSHSPQIEHVAVRYSASNDILKKAFSRLSPYLLLLPLPCQIQQQLLVNVSRLIGVGIIQIRLHSLVIYYKLTSESKRQRNVIVGVLAKSCTLQIPLSSKYGHQTNVILR